MAEVIGPTSTMPGSSHDLPSGTSCDEHPERPAVARIQGETDSMGAELFDLCEECLKEHREAIRNADTSSLCDWCGTEVDARRETRDYDEGMSGPVYMVCAPCRRRASDRAAEEIADHDNRYGDHEWWDEA